MIFSKYNNSEIAEQLQIQDDFYPPYCPNPKCKNHIKGEKFYFKNGWIKTQKKPYYNRRYRCKDCSSQFSFNTFSLDFRKRICGVYEEIYYDSMNTMSNNSIARKIKTSETTIRKRLQDLARQALLAEKELDPETPINEPIAYDGFESFCKSQYSPNYINTAVGCVSLYSFPESYAPLNRKGNMTDQQKEKNKNLIEKYGRYPTNSIRVQTTYLLEKLIERNPKQQLILRTDGHQSYLCSIKKDLSSNSILHSVTSSKERRDSSNPLFPINHLHGRYRHFLSEHKRETIAARKNEAAIMDKIILYRIYKNFMCPQLFRKKKRKRFNTHSPAMVRGLTDHILNFDEIFPYRRCRTQYNLDDHELKIFQRRWDYSREKITPYLGL